MKKKTSPAMKVLSFEITTNMKRMLSDVGDLAKVLFIEAIENKLHPAGPQYWIYKWVHGDPNPEADFLLQLCLPVATFDNTYSGGKFKLQTLPPFTNFSTEHLGGWDNLKITYEKIMSQMKKENLIPGNMCREVYINVDFENPQNNITEVQFEIA